MFVGYFDLAVAAQVPKPGIAPEAPTEVTFHLGPIASNAPVKVTHIILGGKEVPFDTPVPVSGKWLRTLLIVVQNISSKPISRGEVTLDYPETGDGSAERPIVTSYLTLGRHPSEYFLDKDGTRRDSSRENQIPEINIPPGESMSLGLLAYGGVDHAFGDIEQAEFAKKLGHPITQIKVVLGRYYFTSGGGWQLDTFWVPAPPPELWKKATPAQFFGTSTAK